MKLVDIFESVELINESFKDAANVFSKQADPTVVNFYLNKFRELSNKNILSGPEKDITTWVKQGFERFKSFVMTKAQVKTNKEQKASSKLQGAVKIAEYTNWTVIAPLTKEASCQYGAGTQWCTAAKTSNKFDQYFHTNNITLYYLISKNGNRKFAIAFDREFKTIEDIYDAEDDSVDIEQLEHITKIDNLESEVDKWNSNFKPNEPKSRSLDEKIQAADSDESLSIFNDNYDNLTGDQLDALRNKISKNIDNLSEYCLIMNNNQDDPLFVKAPEIMLNSMLQHMMEFNYYAAHLEDWVKLSKTRSPAIEELMPKLSLKIRTGGGSIYENTLKNVAKEYAYKFFNGKDSDGMYKRLLSI